MRKRDVEPQTLTKIRQLRREGLGATRIRDRLYSDETVSDFEDAFDTKKMEADRKKIDRVIKDLNIVDSSGPWSFAAAEDPVAGRYVLDVLAYVVEESEGRITELTNSEADWIIRIRSAFPKMPIDYVWATVRDAVDVVDEDELDTSTIDIFLAFQPWKSEEHRARYREVVARELKRTFDTLVETQALIRKMRPDLAERFGMVDDDDSAVLVLPDDDREKGPSDVKTQTARSR